MKETSVELPASRKASPLELWALALILASHLPFLGAHFYALWQYKPHYQFFPLLLIAIGFLAWQRWPEGGIRFRDSRLALILVLLGLVTLFAGVTVFYPWLAAVAFVLTLCGIVAGLDERDVRQGLLPVCLLLLFVVPPPLDWDENVVRWMQSATSRASSLVLDVFGVRHLMEGNVLVLPGHRLLVEEACSGVSSLFTLVSATACFLVFVRRPAIWSVLLFAASVFWAGLANTARVVTIAVGRASYDVDLSKGWQHDAIGLIAVIVALAMVVSSDCLLAFLLRPIVLPDARAINNPLSQRWNAWMIGEQEAGSTEQGTRGQRSEVRDRRSEVGGKATTIILTACFLLLGILQGIGLTLAASQLKQQSAVTAYLHRPNLFLKTDLPATISGWSQVKFVAEDYDPNRAMGVFRQTWFLRSGPSECAVSADYPFGWGHDLSGCYVANGWTVAQRVQQQPDATASAPQEAYVEVDMLGQGGEHGLLLFSLIDQTGHVVDVPQHLTWQRIRGKAAYNPLWSRVSPSEALQVQAFISTRDPISDVKRQMFQDLYLTARQKLISDFSSKVHL